MTDPLSPTPLSEEEAKLINVPVPLTDLLSKADDQADDLGIVILYPEQVRALIQALRIAVEACERVAALEATADPVAAVTKDRPDHAFALGMAKAYAKHALAAVRELVDLGEKP